MSEERQIEENTPFQTLELGSGEERRRTKVGDRRQVKVYNATTQEEKEITVTCVEVIKLMRDDDTELGEICVWQ